MAVKKPVATLTQIESRILVIRGHKVMLDADLAELYGVETKRLNEQVRRNIERFPDDFMFQLTANEKAEVVANCDHLAKLKYSPSLPYAFTEHGAIMAASVLNSPIAIEVSVHVVRAFVRMRELVAGHKELAQKLNQLERKVGAHDKAIAEGELAISLDPNFSIAHAHLAQIMLFAGRFQDAIALTEKAMRLSPYYPAFYLSALARSYAFKRKYEDALASSKQLHDRSRRNEYPEDWALVHLAGIYAASGRQDEAHVCMAQALKINPGLSIKFFKQTQPFKNSDHLQREIEALTRAGLPKSGK
jgi:tetratricopeptide (TPR) repeat protein